MFKMSDSDLKNDLNLTRYMIYNV